MPNDHDQDRPKPQKKTMDATFADRLYKAAKRLLDIICSVLGLIILSPVFLFVAALLKREAPGSVLYHAERLGVNGLPLKC